MTEAVVLICDRDYLVPTVGAALAARAHLSRAVPILLYLTEPEHELAAAVERIVAPQGVSIIVAKLPGFEAMQVGALHSTHVTLATMARLWLDELLPREVTRFLYLDGDIDISGPLDPLLAAPVPPRGFLAAPEVKLLIDGEIGSRGRVARSYLAGLGLARGADYFNAGVLLVDRAGWGEISAAARDFILAHPERCPFHDQSALNAVAGGARRELSLLWNWQTDFMTVMDPRRLGIRPAIWHFTGFPKPWQAAFPPWGEEFGRSFALGAATLAPLRLAPPPADPAVIADGVRMYEQTRARLLRRYPWRLLTRRRRILAALRRTARTMPPATAPARAGRKEMALADD